MLPECWLAEPAVGNWFRSGPARHGSLSGGLRTRRVDQHGWRLLWKYARAYCGDRQSARRPASAKVGNTRSGRILRPPKREQSVSPSDSTTAAEATETKPLRLSGSQPFTQQPGVYIMI